MPSSWSYLCSTKSCNPFTYNNGLRLFMVSLALFGIGAFVLAFMLRDSISIYIMSIVCFLIVIFIYTSLHDTSKRGKEFGILAISLPVITIATLLPLIQMLVIYIILHFNLNPTDVSLFWPFYTLNVSMLITFSIIFGIMVIVLIIGFLLIRKLIYKLLVFEYNALNEYNELLKKSGAKPYDEEEFSEKMFSAVMQSNEQKYKKLSRQDDNGTVYETDDDDSDDDNNGNQYDNIKDDSKRRDVLVNNAQRSAIDHNHTILQMSQTLQMNPSAPSLHMQEQPLDMNTHASFAKQHYPMGYHQDATNLPNNQHMFVSTFDKSALTYPKI